LEGFQLALGNEKFLLDTAGNKDITGMILTSDTVINDKLWLCGSVRRQQISPGRDLLRIFMGVLAQYFGNFWLRRL